MDSRQPSPSARMGGTRDDRMKTTEALLRRSLDASGAGIALTLDPAFQGLPGTAHGGSVLGRPRCRRGAPGASAGCRASIAGGSPSASGSPSRTTLADGAAACRVRDGDVILVEGRVARPSSPRRRLGGRTDGDGDAPARLEHVLRVWARQRRRPARPAPLRRGRWSAGCGLRPRASAAAQGGLAPLALTSLLDEAAFWLGALASGESGMTTDLAVTLADRRAPRQRRFA